MPTDKSGTDPKQTVKLLDKLKRVGFNDHHFRLLNRKGEKIDAHRNWCQNKRTIPFDVGLYDWQVQRRLEFILREYKYLRKQDVYAESNDIILDRLIKASLAAIPIEKNRGRKRK